MLIRTRFPSTDVARPANPRTTFAKRLRQARLRLGITQTELGLRAGLEPELASPRINQYERGSAEPKHQLARRIARELGIPVAFLYCDDALTADLLLAWSALDSAERKKVVSEIKARVRAKGAGDSADTRAAQPATPKAVKKTGGSRARELEAGGKRAAATLKKK
jgi:transcriptional regulator with XRE-family HTH domain